MTILSTPLSYVALAGVAVVVASCGGSRAGDDVTRVAPLASADGATLLQQQIVGVVRAVSPSVVQIETPQDLGSGVVFDARGDIVTNAHVVGNATRFSSRWPRATATPRRPSAAMPRTTWR